MKPNADCFVPLVQPFNAFTNLLFLGLSSYGIIWLRRLGADRFRSTMITLGFVGLGSGLFHASLLWVTQLMDELPMVGCNHTLVRLDED